MLFPDFFHNKTTDLDDVVFDHRHRSYGAYELRHSYPERIKRAYIFTIGVMITPVLLFVIFNRHTIPPFNLPVAGPKCPTHVVTRYKFPPLSKGAAAKTPSNIWKVSRDSANISDTRRTDRLSTISSIGLPGLHHEDVISTAGLGRADSSTNVIPVIGKVEPTRFATSMPMFPGGDDALIRYFARKINYSQTDIARNIEGTVYVEFTVTSDGTIQDINVVREIGGTFTGQIVSAIKDMPQWQPGKNGTQIVPVRVTLPVRCALHF